MLLMVVMGLLLLLVCAAPPVPLLEMTVVEGGVVADWWVPGLEIAAPSRRLRLLAGWRRLQLVCCRLDH